MIYAVSALAFASVAAGGSVDITSTNIAQGKGGFDNLVAKWGKALDMGGLKTNLDVEYDYGRNKNMVSSATLSGDLAEDGNLKVGYEVAHDFNADSTEATLTASTTQSGTTVSAEYSTADQLREISANRDVSLGGTDVNADVSWCVKAQRARVKLMSALDGGDRVSAAFDYKDGDASGLELSLDHNIEKGKDVSATLSPEKNNLEINYVDTTLEDGATWTATANVDTNGGNLMDSASVTLKRSWEW